MQDQPNRRSDEPSTDPTDLTVGSVDSVSVTRVETLRRLHSTDRRLAEAFRQGVFGMDYDEGRFRLVYLPGGKGYSLARRNERKLRYLLGESCPVDCEGWPLVIDPPGSPESLERQAQIDKDTERRLAEGESPDGLSDPNRMFTTGSGPRSDAPLARVADTETLTRINAEAVDANMISLSDQAIDDLDALGQHVGIPFPGTSEDPAWVLVGWLIETTEHEGRVPTFVMSAASDLVALPQVEVPREVVEGVRQQALDYLEGEGA